MNELKELLLDAVPPLTEPPDRLASVRGRATRRRLRHAGTAAVATVAAVTALGTVLTVLSPAPSADRVGGPAAQSSGPAYVSPWPPDTPVSEPPKDFPMPAAGACPPTVDFLRMPSLDLFPGRTAPPVASVTLCRYNQSTFDLSTGANSLRAGPVVGDVATFQQAFAVAVAPRSSGPASPWASGPACQNTREGPPFPVDVVFVHAPDGTATATTLHRTECDEPTDPYHPLRAAIEAALGEA